MSTTVGMILSLYLVYDAKYEQVTVVWVMSEGARILGTIWRPEESTSKVLAYVELMNLAVVSRDASGQVLSCALPRCTVVERSERLMFIPFPFLNMRTTQDPVSFH